MATRTASVSGLASDTATWGGNPVPVNGDAIVVNTGVVLEWDLDTSGFASGLIASTVNGTFTVTQTPGAYYWKCAGSITWGSAASYLINGGTSGTPLPANVSFKQAFNGNFNNNFNAATTIEHTVTQPTNATVRLTGGESIGATVLEVDTDLTGDPLWAVGALISIDNINNAAQSEERTIDSISSTAITITAGLTAAKLTGSMITLESRNAEIIGLTSQGVALASASNAVSGVAIRGVATAVSLGTGNTLNGVITRVTTGINGGTGFVLNAPMSGGTTAVSGSNAITVNAPISGFSTALSANCSAPIINAPIRGCATAINAPIGAHINADVVGNGTGLSTGSGAIIRNAIFNNSVDVNQTGDFEAYNTAFNGATQFLNYNSAGRHLNLYAESVDNGQVGGGFRAWCRGGIVTNVASPVFDGTRVRSYHHAPESATYPVFMKLRVLVSPGEALTVTCYVRKDASMSYLPRLWVYSAEKTPLVSGSPDVEDIMTDSVDTWETLEATITNSASYPVTYIVMPLAKNASGNVYFDPIIEVGGSGGGVSRARLVNAA